MSYLLNSGVFHCRFQWQQLKTLFVQKLEQVMNLFNKEIPFEHITPRPNVENAKFGDMQKRIIDAMQRFNRQVFKTL